MSILALMGIFTCFFIAQYFARFAMIPALGALTGSSSALLFHKIDRKSKD